MLRRLAARASGRAGIAFARDRDHPAAMCNLYNISKGPQAILDFTRAMRSAAGNLAPGSSYPNYPVPVVRVGEDGERDCYAD